MSLKKPSSLEFLPVLPSPFSPPFGFPGNSAATTTPSGYASHYSNASSHSAIILIGRIYGYGSGPNSISSSITIGSIIMMGLTGIGSTGFMIVFLLPE